MILPTTFLAKRATVGRSNSAPSTSSPPAASTPTTLVSFTGSNGAFPGASPNGTLVLDNSGDLFGTTSTGGTNGNGTLFKLAPTGTTYSFTSLYTFNANTGNRPVGNIIIDSSGTIYGTTAAGGANGTGALLKLAPAGSSFTFSSLFTCAGNSSNGTSTGRNPTGILISDSSGKFFGTAFSGGKKNLGGLFELVPTTVPI